MFIIFYVLTHLYLHLTNVCIVCIMCMKGVLILKKRINIMIDDESLKKIDLLCYALRISRSFAISKLISIADIKLLEDNKKKGSN